MVVVGGIYSPNHQTNRWGRLMSMGAPDCPVRQPRHPTVRVLTVSTVGALSSWGTRQSGAAPDMYYSLSGVPSGAAVTLRELSVHCSCSLFTFVDDRWRSSRCCAWCTGQSGGTPDSPVAHRTVRWHTGQSAEF
jgi:hypothetical protein